MDRSWIRKALAIFALAGAALQTGCVTLDRDGTYRDAAGAVTLELKSGKAGLNYGRIRIDGTYTMDGDKIVIHPTVGDTTQTMIFTVNKDGSIDGPPGSDIAKLQKTK
jgi:hypothetical protein